MKLIANKIELPYGGEITLKFFNPMFNDTGTHSLPINFPAGIPIIQRAFGWPGQKECEIQKSVPGSVDLGNIILSGSWKVIEADQNIIQTYFAANSGDFYSVINKKLLTEIDFGPVYCPTDPTNTWTTLLDEINSKFNCVYPDNDWVAYCAYMPNNKGDGLNYFLVNPVYPGEAGASIKIPSSAGGSNSVFLFVGKVIDTLFESHGYRVEENIFRTDSELQRLTIFHTYNIFPGFGSPYFGIARLDYQKLLPKILCSEFLRAVRNRFNIGFFINEESKSVRVIRFDDIIKKAPLDLGISYGKHKVANNRFSGVNFPLDPPDYFSSHGYADDSEFYNVITVDKYRDVLPDTRDEGDILLVTSEQTYYKIILNDESEKESLRLCPKQFPFIEGDASEEFSQQSGILSMCTYSELYSYDYPPEAPVHYESDVDYLLPHCDLTGNREGEPYTDFPLMFVTARGLQKLWVEDNPGVPELVYPLGSTDLFDACGDPLSNAELALKWGDPEGIIARYWSKRLYWEQNIKKSVKTDIIINYREILNNFSKLIRIGNDNYFVNKFILDINLHTKKISDVELFRV